MKTKPSCRLKLFTTIKISKSARKHSKLASREPRQTMHLLCNRFSNSKCSNFTHNQSWFSSLLCRHPLAQTKLMKLSLHKSLTFSSKSQVTNRLRRMERQRLHLLKELCLAKISISNRAKPSSRSSNSALSSLHAFISSFTLMSTNSGVAWMPLWSVLQLYKWSAHSTRSPSPLMFQLISWGPCTISEYFTMLWLPSSLFRLEQLLC